MYRLFQTRKKAKAREKSQSLCNRTILHLSEGSALIQKASNGF